MEDSPAPQVTIVLGCIFHGDVDRCQIMWANPIEMISLIFPGISDQP